MRVYLFEPGPIDAIYTDDVAGGRPQFDLVVASVVAQHVEEVLDIGARAVVVVHRATR